MNQKSTGDVHLDAALDGISSVTSRGAPEYETSQARALSQIQGSYTGAKLLRDIMLRPMAVEDVAEGGGVEALYKAQENPSWYYAALRVLRDRPGDLEKLLTASGMRGQGMLHRFHGVPRPRSTHSNKLFTTLQKYMITQLKQSGAPNTVKESLAVAQQSGGEMSSMFDSTKRHTQVKMPVVNNGLVAHGRDPNNVLGFATWQQSASDEQRRGYSNYVQGLYQGQYFNFINNDQKADFMDNAPNTLVFDTIGAVRGAGNMLIAQAAPYWRDSDYARVVLYRHGQQSVRVQDETHYGSSGNEQANKDGVPFGDNNEDSESFFKRLGFGLFATERSSQYAVIPNLVDDIVELREMINRLDIAMPDLPEEDSDLYVSSYHAYSVAHADIVVSRSEDLLNKQKQRHGITV